MALKDVFKVPPVLPNKLQKRLKTNVGGMKTHKKLKDSEWKFVQELVANDGKITMKEAAIRAGFSPKAAKTTAWKLTNPELAPHVVAAIQSYRAELSQKYGTSFDRHMRDMQTIRDAALEAGAFGAAVQAEYRRGQALGTIYIDKKEVRYGTIDGMSKDEVVMKLEEIKKIYGPAPQEILDVEAKDVSCETSVKPKKILEAPIADTTTAT